MLSQGVKQVLSLGLSAIFALSCQLKHEAYNSAPLCGHYDLQYGHLRGHISLYQDSTYDFSFPAFGAYARLYECPQVSHRGKWDFEEATSHIVLTSETQPIDSSYSVIELIDSQLPEGKTRVTIYPVDSLSGVDEKMSVEFEIGLIERVRFSHSRTMNYVEPSAIINEKTTPVEFLQLEGARGLYKPYEAKNNQTNDFRIFVLRGENPGKVMYLQSFYKERLKLDKDTIWFSEIFPLIRSFPCELK